MARPRKTFGCSVEGCEGVHAAKGYCQRHYMAWYSHGDPLWVPKRKHVPVVGSACCEDGCARKPGKSGRCRKHYLQWRREMGIAPRRGRCSVEGCQEPQESKGFCELHYYAFRKYGDPPPPHQIKKTGWVHHSGGLPDHLSARPGFHPGTSLRHGAADRPTSFAGGNRTSHQW